MILVTGATGNVGSEIAKQLSAANSPFRIYVRDAEKAAQLIGPGDYQTALGTFADEAAFATALEGVDAIFMVTKQSDEFKQDFTRMAGHIKAAGIQRFVMLSAENDPDSDIFFLKRTGELEVIAAEADLPWTFLRPDWFMQNFAAYIPSGMMAFPHGPGKTSFIDVRDVAEVAVKALVEDGHVRRTYRLTGPDPMTFKGATARIGAALGRDIPFIDLPLEDMRAAMIEGGSEEWNADMNVEMTTLFRKGFSFNPSNDVEFLLGRKPRSIETYVADHATLLGAS